MATLVTGGTGFVGSNIVKTLAQRGHRVVCFDLAPPNDLLTRYIQPWADQVTFLQGDILAPGDLEQTEDHNIDKIVHAAVFTGVLPEVEASRSRSIVDINVMGTTNLLELARRTKPQRFLYVSSGSVYGDRPEGEDVLREDAELHPHSLYESTKYVSELLTRRFGEMHGFQTCATRLSSPYGPMERVTGHRANQSVLKDLTGKIIRGEPIAVGDRGQGRDYTYVPDIAAGICSVLDAPNPSHFAYNVSSGRWVSLGDIIDALQEIRPGIQVVEAPPGDDSFGGSRSRMDVSRLRNDIGFTAEYDLAAGLTAYLKWREEYDFRD
ncbi:MAG: NAD(P)-dependent oxidoreductase [Chloroflexi bacterium]|nr:NAD(P)-dependent oxidoreductase [Chloroflexota bacterium]